MMHCTDLVVASRSGGGFNTKRSSDLEFVVYIAVVCRLCASRCGVGSIPCGLDERYLVV